MLSLAAQPDPSTPQEFLAQELLLAAGKEVLDAGCGNGRFSLLFAQHGAKVTAFDIDPTGIAELRNKIGQLPITAFVADAEKIVFKEDFDIIISFGFIHHVSHKIVLPKLIAALKTNGRFVLIEPVRYPAFWESVTDLYHRLSKDLVPGEAPLDLKTVLPFFDEFSLIRETRYNLIFVWARLLKNVKVEQFLPKAAFSSFRKLDRLLLRFKFLAPFYRVRAFVFLKK